MDGKGYLLFGLFQSGISPTREEVKKEINKIVAHLDDLTAIHDNLLIFGCGDNNAEAM